MQVLDASSNSFVVELNCSGEYQKIIDQAKKKHQSTNQTKYLRVEHMQTIFARLKPDSCPSDMTANFLYVSFSYGLFFFLFCPQSYYFILYTNFS